MDDRAWAFHSYMAELRLSFGSRRVTRPTWEQHARSERYWIGQAWWTAGHGTPLSHLRCCWRAMREAWLCEWHRAIGSTYETTVGDRKKHAIITGLTA